MARGSLPAQTPQVPEDTFIAFDFLYRFVQRLDADVARVEVSEAGVTLAVASAVDTAVVSPLVTDLAFTPAPNSTYVVEGQLVLKTNEPGAYPTVLLALPSDILWVTCQMRAAVSPTAEVLSATHGTAAPSITATGMVEELELPMSFQCTFRTGPSPVGDFAVTIS